MSTQSFVVIGSGPGIGATTASLFAQRKFYKLALISRNESRLQEDKKVVESAALEVGRDVQVITWSVDITDSVALRDVLERVNTWCQVGCIHFNTARVDFSTRF